MSKLPFAFAPPLAVALSVALAACAPAVGHIRVLAPPGASVYLDEHPQGEIGPDGLLIQGVPVGAHQLRVSRDGHREQQVSVVVQRWQKVELGFAPLEPLVPAVGAEAAEGVLAPTDEGPLAVSPLEAMRGEQARAFYRAGDGQKALVVLRDAEALAPLRLRIEQVVALHARAGALADAGDEAAARPLWDRLLVLEPDAENWYHRQARARRR